MSDWYDLAVRPRTSSHRWCVWVAILLGPAEGAWSTLCKIKQIRSQKLSTENVTFWPCCSLIPFPLYLTWLHLPPIIHLKACDAPPGIHICFPTAFLSFLLSFKLYNCTLINRTYFFKSLFISSAGPPLQTPPPQGKEGAQEAQEAWPQRGGTPWRGAQPGPQPRPLLNQKDRHPLLSCRLQLACLPVVLISTNTTSNFQPMYPLSLPVLPLAPHPLALRGNLLIIPLWGLPKCCQVLPGL